MDCKHEIILSMYYMNPDNDPKRIPDWFCNMGIDLTQLLLVTEGVFDVSLYKFKTLDGIVIIVPQESYRKECISLIVEDDENLRKAGIIKRLDTHQDIFLEGSLWKSLPLHKRSKSYRLTILINNINGTHIVTQRDSIAEYCLFSERGVFFVGYLFFLLKNIIINGFITTELSTAQMIQLINCEYNRILDVFSQKNRILDELECRESHSKYHYSLENESIEFCNWIDEKKSLTNASMFEFVFQSTVKPKTIASILVRQIVSILDVISEEKDGYVMWKKVADELPDERKQASFETLCSMTKTLQKDYVSQDFQKQQWAYNYLKELDLISKTI